MKITIKLLLLLFLVALLSCNSDEKSNKESKSENLESSYLDKGHTISEESFNALRTELMKAMGQKGIGGAIEFCNIEALPLTDSLSKAFDATIRRTSLKWRNPKNKPTDEERVILEEFESLFKSGTTIKHSIINLSDTEVLYVRPIYAQGLCQNCHGTPGSTLSPDNHAIIKKLYPEDKATDYQSGDLRGMWSIKFNVNK